MADEVNAINGGGKFTPHPEGQYAAVCVDVVAMGDKVDAFPGSPPKISAKCALVFRSGERNDTGEDIDISAEFTVSMYETAALRKFLESWRGKSYTEEQAKQGVPVHKLVSVGALLSVEHKKSAAGRTYAKIKSISPLPKQMTAPELTGYERAPFWADRKKAYAEEVAKFRQQAMASSHDDYQDPGSDDVDDELPF